MTWLVHAIQNLPVGPDCIPRGRVNAIAIANRLARGRRGPARAGRADEIPAAPGADPRRPPRWRSSRTSPRPARSSGRWDGRLQRRGGSRAGMATSRSSRRDRIARIAADGTTSPRMRGIRHSPVRSAGLPCRYRSQPPSIITFDWPSTATSARGARRWRLSTFASVLSSVAISPVSLGGNACIAVDVRALAREVFGAV
jgi:hypothetical protein